jgi:hypothetical protein
MRDRHADPAEMLGIADTRQLQLRMRQMPWPRPYYN